MGVGFAETMGVRYAQKSYKSKQIKQFYFTLTR
jgi:hypothetical protein